ncbi:MAG: septum formation initiator family protein [Ardenticatenaceae bacterium]
MTSRLLNDTLLTIRTRRLVLSPFSGMSRTIARVVIALLTVIGLFVFVYLSEVTQVTTTTFDIEQMKLDYHQLQEQNHELEREIAELESPPHVLRYVREHGMIQKMDREYIWLEQ